MKELLKHVSACTVACAGGLARALCFPRTATVMHAAEALWFTAEHEPFLVEEARALPPLVSLLHVGETQEAKQAASSAAMALFFPHFLITFVL